MIRGFSLMAMFSIFMVSLATVAHAQKLCEPDIDYISAVGHDQGEKSRATLNSAFKSAAEQDFKGFLAVAAEPYIQHSPDLPDGWKPVWNLLADRPAGFSSERMMWLGPKGYLDNGSYLVMLHVTRTSPTGGTPRRCYRHIIRK